MMLETFKKICDEQIRDKQNRDKQGPTLSLIFFSKAVNQGRGRVKGAQKSVNVACERPLGIYFNIYTPERLRQYI